MSYDARVFRVLIASPSDVEEERDLVVSSIQAWNDLYSHARKVVLLPLRWETHTAPEYGTRPQEVINRAIVDECDLLVGIFWTRIGTPTGVADSGTLEEIERAGKAGKPIMLYFSRVEIDPETIDIKQIEKLKDFKNNTYPRGLVEVYRKLAEFKDKFSRQLEIKIRELQQSENAESNPLALHTPSNETGKPAGSEMHVTLALPHVEDFSDVPAEKLEGVKARLTDRIRRNMTVPIVLGLENVGSIGLRNLYLQLEFRADTPDMELSDVAPSSKSSETMLYFASHGSFFSGEDRAFPNLDKLFKVYESETLQKMETGWKIALEWDAIHQGRLLIVKPWLFLYAPSGGRLNVKINAYADSSPEPYALTAVINVSVRRELALLSTILPKWNEDENDSFAKRLLYLDAAKTSE